MRTDGIRGRSPNSVAARSELGLRPRILTQPWFLFPAAAILLLIAGLGTTPYAIAQPWDTLWHFLAYAGLTLVLWIATDGRRPWLVPGAVMLLGFASVEAVSAAMVTAGALSFFQAKPKCAESSPR